LGRFLNAALMVCSLEREDIMSKRETSFYLFLGVSIGFAVGASAGLLFAPASGEKTRRMLRKKAEKGQEYLAELSDSAGEIGKKMTRS
jgi:gas vesicle protein